MPSLTGTSTSCTPISACSSSHECLGVRPGQWKRPKGQSEEHWMKLKTFLLGTALAGLFAGAAEAQVSVKIGVLNDRSGLYADISGEGSAVAARMAAEDFKAKDKGINVEIISADHQNKPDVGSNIARQWYDTDGVDVITDVPTSSVALAINQITKEKNKVFLNSGAASSDLTGKACSPTTPSGTRSSATPRRSSRRTAARCWARSAIPSRARTSPPSCSRPRLPRPR